MIRVVVFAFIFYSALSYILTFSGLVPGIKPPVAPVISEPANAPNAVEGALEKIPLVGNLVGAADAAGQAFAFAIEMAGTLFALFTFQVPGVPLLMNMFLMIPLAIAGAFVVIGVIRGISPT